MNLILVCRKNRIHIIGKAVCGDLYDCGTDRGKLLKLVKMLPQLRGGEIPVVPPPVLSTFDSSKNADCTAEASGISLRERISSEDFHYWFKPRSDSADGILSNPFVDAFDVVEEEVNGNDGEAAAKRRKW